MADSLSRVLPVVGVASLTVSVASSAYRSRHDVAALAFVLLCYVDLLSLFLCLKWLEKLGPDGSPETRSRLRAAVWTLATALDLAFAWRVGLAMPGPPAIVVWSLAMAVSLGGFYGMFVYAGGDGEVVERGYLTLHTDEQAKGASQIAIAAGQQALRPV